MGLRSIVVFFLVAPLLPGLTASSGQTAQAEPEPRYDSATTVDMMTVVAEMREVPRGSPLSGSHLIVRPESAKENSETIDVYLGPANYLKDFDVTFAKGDRVQVIGSKVKYGGASVVLARQVRRDSTTIYLRDEHGIPYWRGRT
ncbi:MAG: hypothetical protein ABSF62_03520 [Bryobacteraceae bacterium]